VGQIYSQDLPLYFLIAYSRVICPIFLPRVSCRLSMSIWTKFRLFSSLKLYDIFAQWILRKKLHGSSSCIYVNIRRLVLFFNHLKTLNDRQYRYHWNAHFLMLDIANIFCSVGAHLRSLADFAFVACLHPNLDAPMPAYLLSVVGKVAVIKLLRYVTSSFFK
jgi:hypothetical protein